ncbi:MAG: hypothetical protein Q9167_004948 [Letrouitia subvulpina]
MSTLFGWSLSDTILLAKYIRTVHRALDEEGGSSSEYQQATAVLTCLQHTLQQIQYGLRSTDPTFRNAIKGQLDGSISSIAQFNAKLQENYGEYLGASPASKHKGLWPKSKWAFKATKELMDFWLGLSRQLEIIKLLIISETISGIEEMCDRVVEVNASIREVHELLTKLNDQQLDQKQATESQYEQIHCHLSDFWKALEDWTMVPTVQQTTSTKAEASCRLLLRSRNTITQKLIEGIDIVGAMIEVKLELYFLSHGALIHLFRAARFIRGLQIFRIHIQYKYLDGATGYKVQRNEYKVLIVGDPHKVVTEANWNHVISTQPSLVVSADAKSSPEKPTSSEPISCPGLTKSSGLRFPESTLGNLAPPKLVEDTVDINLNIFKHLSITLWKFSTDNNAVMETANNPMTDPESSFNDLYDTPAGTYKSEARRVAWLRGGKVFYPG